MLKKRNLIFLSLLILGILLLTSCFSNPPVTEGILKGQVLVPEGSIKTKNLTDQALPGATVNIIGLSTGDIIATTITDTNGYYQVFVPAGGPYLMEAIKEGVKVQQITPQVEAGKEYDLGTADCATTAIALIAQAMLEAEDYPNDLADISLAEIEAYPNFNDVMSIVFNAIKTGVDPTESALVHQAIDNFLATCMGTVHNITQDIHYTAIQAALDAANSGDIIEVDDGTYAESITFPDGKVITLRSLNDASSTIITGVDGSATVTCGFLEGTTTLEGFTINHESGNTGRGITLTAGYLTINNCIISDNSATDGGGIYNHSGSLIITGSAISGNSVSTIGGGIYNHYGFLTITGSTISGNSASTTGGGIFNWNGILAIITNCTISGNSANPGGGISNYDTLTITDCTISDNIANHGGGISNYGTLTITDCTISDNTALIGGGIGNEIGTLTITGSTISNNSVVMVGGWGGGISNSGTLTITGSTISGNSANDGSGIYLKSETNVTIGGSNNTDLVNFNHFTDNYYEGSFPSADQHISNDDGDCRANYPYNYFIPGSFTFY